MNNLYQEMQTKQVKNAANNPQLQAVIDLIRKSGKSPKELFLEKSREMGVDPNVILNQLR